MGDGLMDEIHAELDAKTVYCHTCKAIARLDDKDRADVNAAFADPSIPAIAIMRVLNRRGAGLSESGVLRHRRRCEHG